MSDRDLIARLATALRVQLDGVNLYSELLAEAAARALLAEAQPARLRYCDVRGQQPDNAWGCPECVREMRQQLAEAQPEPVEPTDEELIALADDCDLDRLEGERFDGVNKVEEGCWEAWDHQLIAFARAALQRWGRPAPEPVQPTDKAQQWYSYCPEEGIEVHQHKELAQKAAQQIMGCYASSAHSDGWHEDMELVSWGMLLPVDQAQVVERVKADPASGFDEWVKYELRPVIATRTGLRPAPEPVSVACDAAWREFIEAVQHAQHVAKREGECPPFDLVETAFALWRSAAPEPVSVTERLPTASDCDGWGRCWHWDPFVKHSCWVFMPPIDYPNGICTHWLPHWALPVPLPTTEQ